MGNQTQGDDRKTQATTQDAGSRQRSDSQQPQGSQGQSASPKQGQGAVKGQDNTIERSTDDSGAGRNYSAKDDDLSGTHSDEENETGRDNEMKQSGKGGSADRGAPKRGNP